MLVLLVVCVLCCHPDLSPAQRNRWLHWGIRGLPRWVVTLFGDDVEPRKPNCEIRTSSRVDSALLDGVRHPVNRQHVSGDAIVDVVASPHSEPHPGTLTP